MSKKQDSFPSEKIYKTQSQYWFLKVNAQYKHILENKADSIDASLDIALNYIYLFQCFESTIDEIADELSFFVRQGKNVYQEYYVKENLYLKDKIFYLITLYAPSTKSDDIEVLIKKVKEFTNKRNKILHLQEIAWEVTTNTRNRQPRGLSEILTLEKYKKQYSDTQSFLTKIKEILKNGLGNKTINVHNKGKVKEHNLIENIFSHRKLLQDLPILDKK